MGGGRGLQGDQAGMCRELGVSGRQGLAFQEGVMQLAQCSRIVHKVKVRKVSFGFSNWEACEATGDLARTDSGK